MRTVNEVSKLSGVSIRTLQYYDKIGYIPQTIRKRDTGCMTIRHLPSCNRFCCSRNLSFRSAKLSAFWNAPTTMRIRLFPNKSDFSN